MNAKSAATNDEVFEELLIDSTECFENSECLEIEKGNSEDYVEPEVRDKSSNGNIITAYLNEIKKWPILSREKEMSLATAYSEAEKKKLELKRHWVIIFSGISSLKVPTHFSYSLNSKFGLISVFCCSRIGLANIPSDMSLLAEI